MLTIVGGSLTTFSGCSATDQSATDQTGLSETDTGSTLTSTPTPDGPGSTTASATDPGSVTKGSWPMIDFDAGNTNYNPTATGFDEKPRRQWRQPFVVGNFSGVPVLDPPLLADGYLITEDGTGDVFAIAIGDGEVGLDVDGSHSLPYEYRGHTPNIATADRYYGIARHRETDTRRFVAHDLEGEVEWEADVPAVGAVAAGEVVIVTIVDEDRPMAGVVALDRANGTEQWRQTAETEAYPLVAASPDRVFVAHQQRTTAYDTATGDQRWEFALPEAAADAELRFGLPMVTGPHMVVPAVGPATQAPIDRLWSLPRDGPPTRWEKADEGHLFPRVVSDTVAVVGPGRALALDNGSEQWSNSEAARDLLDSEYGPQDLWDVVASESTLVLGTGPMSGMGEYPGFLAGVDLVSGEFRWEVEVESGVRHLVVVDEGLFVVTQEGAVEGYR